ncbi:SH3 domain-containing protein [Aurantivibrio infirmus]
MKLRVIEKHESNYPNPIEFNIGDILKLGTMDKEFEGWIRAATKDGNEGWAPLDYIEIITNKSLGKAVCKYSAKELDVAPGQILEILKEHNGWVWCLAENGNYGWVPKKVGVIA